MEGSSDFQYKKISHCAERERSGTEWSCHGTGSKSVFNISRAEPERKNNIFFFFLFFFFGKHILALIHFRLKYQLNGTNLLSVQQNGSILWFCDCE